MTQLFSASGTAPLKSDLLLRSERGKYLFCVAANVLLPNLGWQIVFSYLHAKDRVQAKLGYCRAHPNRNTHHIIDISLAIGFFHEKVDASGEIQKDLLSAD